MLHKALDSRSVNAKKLKRLEVLSRAVVVAEAATRHVKLISPAVAALKFLVETLRVNPIYINSYSNSQVC